MSNRRWLLAILATSALLRGGMAVGLQILLDHRLHRQFLVEGDANGYWILAEAIVEGRPYRIYDPPRAVLRMPGFPFLLAAGMKTADVMGLSGHRAIVVRLWLAMIGTLACYAVYLLGRDLRDAVTGRLAAGLAAISPPFVGFSVLELSETAFACGLTFNLWCFVRLARSLGFLSSTAVKTTSQDGSTKDIWHSSSSRRGNVLGWATAVGLSAAIANLLRPSWMLAPPLMAGGLLILAVLRRQDRRSCLMAAAVLLIAFFAALTPWACRNHRVTGHWIWTTLWVGPSLYDGLHPAATGDSDMRFFEQDRLPQGMSEYEVDREYRRRAWEFVRFHPGRAVELAMIKSARYWNPIPNATQFSQWWIRLPFGLATIVILTTAAMGLWREKGRWEIWAFCAVPVLYFGAVHSVFVGSVRYRLPAEYPLLVASAVGFPGGVRRKLRIGLS